MKKRRKLDDFYAFAKSVHIAYGSNPAERVAALPQVMAADAAGCVKVLCSLTLKVKVAAHK
ncbi:MAG: hypothetical protein V8R06_06970 [Dialister hominis]|uniref:hypothetical protein n=1 Tax=Dialister hominis TaxID=2582419 RepID=UPI0026DEFDDB|nr:hypothetical protein [uncultured Dialister sp.]